MAEQKQDLREFVSNPFTDCHPEHHLSFCVDIPPQELNRDELYHLIEEKTGLKFHTHDHSIPQIFHGEVNTRWPAGKWDCSDQCQIEGRHFQYIVSFYGIDKEPDLVNHHTYKVIDHTPHLENLAKAHQEFV